MKTLVGYSGGAHVRKSDTVVVPVARPSYRSVCRGEGNFVEAILIEYDPSKITYRELLDVFIEMHDPTAKKKRQYCSAIFATSAAQKVIAEEVIGNNENFLTVVEECTTWTNAEKRHQKYFEKKAAKKAAMRRFTGK